MTNKHLQDDDAAREYLEKLRWPDGPICPHCGGVDNAYGTKRGIYRCANAECRKDFSVTVGTIFERSKIPLHKWLTAFRLMCASKKGISAHQLHRMLGVTYKSAWFMAHRIREAMRTGGLAPNMGGQGGIVEADETFFGKLRGEPKGKAYHHKMKVLTLVDRDTGQARSAVIENVKASTIAPIVIRNLAREARLVTDEASYYIGVGEMQADHQSVRHSIGEYGRGEIHTNTVEGYFSIFKRGMRGVYQHCSEEHLHRYLAEFDFRYNNRAALKISDAERADRALLGAAGKRLTYRRAD